ncbi:MAG: DUF2163 domain-containing protein [Hyphomicrobiales bacterium]
MKTLPEGLAASLAGGATTHCRCWVVTRRDGAVLGFTDHDRSVALDGVVCEPASGFTASEATSELGLVVGGLEIDGALSSERITEDDLLAGHYDGAAVELWLVDWSAPANRLRLRRADIGEIERADGVFRAELRSLAHHLDQVHGRTYRFDCDADLGDSRCRIDTSLSTYRAAGTVLSTSGDHSLVVSGLSGFAAGWFAFGRLDWTSGANAGRAVEVAGHTRTGGSVVLDLWQAMSRPVAPTDAFVVTAGCDRRFSTCRDKFSNAKAFRGFPHMPGNDFALSYPRSGNANDGRSLNT